MLDKRGSTCESLSQRMKDTHSLFGLFSVPASLGGLTAAQRGFFTHRGNPCNEEARRKLHAAWLGRLGTPPARPDSLDMKLEKTEALDGSALGSRSRRAARDYAPVCWWKYSLEPTKPATTSSLLPPPLKKLTQ